MLARFAGAVALMLCHAGALPAAAGQQGGTLASTAFAGMDAPAPGPARAHGDHARGCLAGAVALAGRGAGWRVARPGRNRHWGHPAAIAFVERLATRARAAGWPGLAIGDIAQPRGGPMPSGHRSHQTGLDIDIRFRATDPDGALRGAPGVVVRDGRALNARWRKGHARLLRLAARDPAVDRIFVHPAIKAALCAATAGGDRAWLRRIRWWWGHDAHFHVRLACPEGSGSCRMQDPPPPGPGCDATLAWWFTAEARGPAPATGPRRPATLADLPRACAGLVTP